MTRLPVPRRTEKVGAMRRLAPLALAAVLATAGCGGSDDGEAASPAATPAAAASPILGEYTQRVRIADLGPDDDPATAGAYSMTLDADSYESFTPKGPGIAGPGRAHGDRYVFEADYRRDCADAATYRVVSEGERVTFEAAAPDPCEIRRSALTIAPWRVRDAG